VQTVVETPVFLREAERLLSEEEHYGLIAYLAMHPLAGDEIVGTGGVRKLRFAAKGIYAKNERADLTAEQRKSVASLAAAIKALRKRE